MHVKVDQINDYVYTHSQTFYILRFSVQRVLYIARLENMLVILQISERQSTGYRIQDADKHKDEGREGGC